MYHLLTLSCGGGWLLPCWIILRYFCIVEAAPDPDLTAIFFSFTLVNFPDFLWKGSTHRSWYQCMTFSKAEISIASAANEGKWTLMMWILSCYTILPVGWLQLSMLECRPVATSWSVSMAWAISACMGESRIFVGQRRFSLLFLFSSYLEIIGESTKPTVERLSYIFHDSSISRDSHLLTINSALEIFSLLAGLRFSGKRETTEERLKSRPRKLIRQRRIKQSQGPDNTKQRIPMAALNILIEGQKWLAA